MAEPCNHTHEESWPIYDGHGIYLARVCERCEKKVLARYRPDIMEAYETDEPIEVEE